MLWSKPKASLELPSVKVQSQNIYLRSAQLSDWPQWVNVRESNREHLQPFEPKWGENCFEEEFFKRRLQRQAREWYLGQAHAFLIFAAQNNELIGGMNINNIARGAAQFCTLGYWIAKENEGQGLMKESLTATIRYCFEELKLHRINCSCLLHNTRSKNLLLSAGFEEEGLAKQYLQINGQWQDHLLFGLPKETWEFRSSARQTHKTQAP